jgi:hypothetical protein
MFSEIVIQESIDSEYDLEGIDLENHYLMVDYYEGIYIYYNTYRFIINKEFIISDNLSLIEENYLCPPLILKVEQKEEIKNILKDIII